MRDYEEYYSIIRPDAISKSNYFLIKALRPDLSEEEVCKIVISVKAGREDEPRAR